MRAVLLVAALALGACAAQVPAGGPGPVGQAEDNGRQQTHHIPVTQADGSQILLLGRTCRPDGNAPARVVVIAHGSPPVASARPRMQLTACNSEAVRWFTSRGNLVVLALRRGYGGTGGAYVEDSTPCTVDNYVRIAKESARDLAATIAYALKLPYARPDGAVVVGQSAGGWAAVGLDSEPHPGVAAIVSMAGGRGGHVGDQPNRNCHPENLAAAAGTLGHAATIPMLWVYTENDSYFSPYIARSMYDAFTAGGGKADFQALPAFGTDGHQLFFGRGGSAVWGPLMERYLRERGAA